MAATESSDTAERRAGIGRPVTTVTVYSTGPRCMRCAWTCRRLEEAGIPFTLIDITRPENASFLQLVTDQLGYSEAPIVVIDDEPEHHWCGFRPDLLDQLVGSIGSRP